MRQERWIVVDSASSETIWKSLLPSARFVACETLTALQDVSAVQLHQALCSPEPHTSPEIIFIHADCQLFEKPTTPVSRPTLGGVELAIRLRQDPDKFRCPIMLVSFRRRADAVDTDRRFWNDQFLESFLTGQWHVHWIRLAQKPDNLTRLANDACRALASKLLSVKAWKGLAHTACKTSVERSHRRYRHGKGSFTTALWLLAGAYRAGQLPLDHTLRTIEQIEKLRVAAGEPYDFALFRRYLGLLSPAGTHNRDSARSQGKHQLLIIEDEDGWCEAVRGLLGKRWNVVRLKSEAALRQHPLDDYHLILLDENLGDNERSGLDLIPLIRAVDPLCPLVLFTSNRAPSVSTEALRRGASDIFLKQSSDADDRGIDEYFQTFSALIDDFEVMDVRARVALTQAWQLASAMHVALKQKNGSSKSSKSLQGLEHAICLLAVGIGAIGRDTNLEATIGAAYISLDRCLRDALVSVGASQDSDVLVMLQSAGKPAPPWLTTFSSAVRLARHGDVAGGKRGGRGKLASSQIQAAVEDCLLCAQWIGTNCFTRLSTARLPRPRNKDLRRHGTSRTPTSHDARSQQGALRFLLGFFAASDKASWSELAPFWRSNSDRALPGIMDAVEQFEAGHQPRAADLGSSRQLIVVDDHAEQDGWIVALTSALGAKGWTVINLAKSADELQRRLPEIETDTSVVLLDLNLPMNAPQEGAGVHSERVGLNCLAEIRSAHPDLPVIVFSATEGAFWARKCLRPAKLDGAPSQAYFPKTGDILPVGSANEHDFFLDYYLSLIELLDLPRPVVRRGQIVELAKSLVQPLTFSFLDQARGRRREETKTLLSVSLGVPKRTTIAEMMVDYLRPEFSLMLRMAWAAEDPYYRALAHRLFPNGSLAMDASTTTLSIFPTAVVEMLAKVLFALSWNRWPTDMKGWQKTTLVCLRKNRRFFSVLDSDEFDEAWLPLFYQRNAVRHETATATAEFVAPFCRVTQLLCQGMEEAVKKTSGGLQPPDGSNANGSTADWRNLKSICDRHQVTPGTVLGRIRGGFHVELHGVLGFWPYPGSPYPDLATAKRFRGKNMHFLVKDCDVSKRNVVLTLGFGVGDVVECVIRGVTPFGASVESSGLSGVLSASEMLLQRGTRPTDILKIGQIVTARVVRMEMKNASQLFEVSMR